MPDDVMTEQEDPVPNIPYSPVNVRPGNPTVVESTFRVRYAETDAQRVVHHSRYIPWMEVGRAELFRAAGGDYPALERRGLALVATQITGHYHAPAVYDEFVTVRAQVVACRSRQLVFGYEVVRTASGQRLFTGQTVHIPATREGRAVTMPGEVTAAVARLGVVANGQADKVTLWPPVAAPHCTTFPVRYAETDAMGIVYQANFVVWFEAGRVDFFLARGMNYADFEQSGYFLPVTHLALRIHAPARFGDRVTVRSWLADLKSRQLTLAYEIVNAVTGQRLASGDTVHLCTLADSGRAVSLPPAFRQQLATRLA